MRLLPVLAGGLAAWALVLGVLTPGGLWFLLPLLPWLWATAPTDAPPTGMAPLLLVLGLPGVIAVGAVAGWLGWLVRARPGARKAREDRARPGAPPGPSP